MQHACLDFRKGFLSLILFSSITFCSCTMVASEGQKQFGPDADYFIGLQLLKDKNYNAARTKFNKCVKKGSPYCAKKSAEALTTFGDLQEKNQAALNLVKLYPDSDSLLIAVRQLYSTEEFHKLIEITDSCDFSTEYNETLKYRLEAKQKRGDSDFYDEVFKWFTLRPVSEFHYKFYRDSLNHFDFDSLALIDLSEAAEPATPFYSPEEFILNYRIKMYRRDYTYCLENAAQIEKYFYSLKESCKEIPSQLVSDFGKAYLYGSQNYGQNGAKFRKLAADFSGSESEYFFWFYAGRFYAKGELYISQTQKCFNSAISTAKTDSQKDNALWYLLDSSLNSGINTIINSIGNYSRQWSDASYFDDFFESLFSSLLAGGKWDSFYSLYQQIDGYASDEITAQAAYIYARLLEEGYATAQEGKSKEECIKESFTRALNSGSSAYYKILAAFHLNLDEQQLENILCSQKSTQTNQKQTLPEINQAAENLLKGYAFFGFPELIYQNYLDLYKTGISTDTSIYLADFLQKCGNQNHDYYNQSLKIAARAYANGNRDLTKNDLQSLYPQDYLEIVKENCNKYEIDLPVMFALIRSESFFDADVKSSAGAVGLCQLMEFTGADIAQRLHKADYDLNNPEDNIEFGCYYLKNLYSRCENSYLQAFFAYNAGITRVRRWLQSSLVEFGKKKNMPGDLFLETLPYSETREYGRKLVSASVMYEWLYDEENNSKIAFQNMIENLIY